MKCSMRIETAVTETAVSNHTVSVIVPNYNHAAFLRQRIDSILEQNYQDYEVLLLDDCSTDGSRAVLESYRSHPKVSQIVFNEQNSRSAFRQWDKGIALATGEWIWIAESDDWADTRFLETMMTHLLAHPECGLGYCRSHCTDEAGNILWEVVPGEGVTVTKGHDLIQQKLVLTSTIMNVSSCVFRKSLFQQEKQILYEKMRLCGDWFFYVLLAEQTDVLKVKEPLNYCRRHGKNIAESAEARGLTFLEGADVLEYILARYHVDKFYYSKYWGRQWAKYHRKWNFSKETNRAVLRRFYKKHLLIVLFYWIYRIKLNLKHN